MITFINKFDNKTYAFPTNKLYLPKFEIFEEMFEKLIYIDNNTTFYVHKNDYNKYRNFFNNSDDIEFDIKIKEVNKYYIDIRFFDMFTLLLKAKHKKLLLNILNTHTILLDINNIHYYIIKDKISFLTKSYILKMIIDKQPTINIELKNIDDFKNELSYLLVFNIFTKLNIEGIKLPNNYKDLIQLYEKIRVNENILKNYKILFNSNIINVISVKGNLRDISKNFERTIVNKIVSYLKNILKDYSYIKIENNKTYMYIDIIINFNKDINLDYQKIIPFIKLKNILNNLFYDTILTISLNDITLPDFIFKYLKINREFDYLNLLDNVKFIGYNDKFYDKHIKKFKDMKILNNNLFTHLL